MKVYFAGSIRGGRHDAELYRKVINALKEKHQVLTEHVGDLSWETLPQSIMLMPLSMQPTKACWAVVAWMELSIAPRGKGSCQFSLFMVKL